MKQNQVIYRLKEGYNPMIFNKDNCFIYSFPVTSGHIDNTFEFQISKSTFDALVSNEYRFKLVYFILFHEAQKAFGTGNLKPRSFSIQEFEMYLNLVLTKSEIDLKKYCISYLYKSNFSEKYFDSFLESVFG